VKKSYFSSTALHFQAAIFDYISGKL